MREGAKERMRVKRLVEKEVYRSEVCIVLFCDANDGWWFPVSKGSNDVSDVAL